MRSARNGIDGRRFSRRSLACALLVVAGAVVPSAAADDWPMFHRDALHSGLSAETAISVANASTLGVDWQVNTGSPARTSPVVVHSAALGRDLVYEGSASGVVSAYDAASGQRVWWHKVGASVNSTPAYSAGRIWFGSSDRFLYALNADTGSQACRFSAGGVISASAVVADPGSCAVVYFGG